MDCGIAAAPSPTAPEPRCRLVRKENRGASAPPIASAYEHGHGDDDEACVPWDLPAGSGGKIARRESYRKRGGTRLQKSLTPFKNKRGGRNPGSIRFLECDASAFEPAGSDGSENEASHVCKIGHATGLHVRHLTRVDELSEEPETDQECRWNERYLHKDEDQQDGLDPIARIGHQERTHHGRDGSARPEVWNGGVGRGGDLRQRGCQSSQEIERKVSPSAHRIFDLRTEGPEKNHVDDDVRPAPMQKHGGQDRDPVVAGNNLGGNHAPLNDKL